MMSVLIIDDEINIIKSFKSLLGNEYEVFEARSGEAALECITARRIDFVFLDYNLGGENGIEVLGRIKEIDPDLYVVMISGYGDSEVIIKAMALGCYDYLEKPLDIDKINLLLKRALRSKKIDNTVKLLVDEQSSQFNLKRIIGKSPLMQNVFKQIGLLLDKKVSVLITGENGTGKELVAKALHYSGSEREEPFVAVNCSGLTDTLLDNELFGHEAQAFTGATGVVKGKFEIAGEGTIFLDEIGDMPMPLQVKLLRVLQEREFQRLGGNRTIKLKARVIAATNKDIINEIKSGRFRQDLFFRINVAQIEIPPLRERKEDIPLLLDYFVKEARLKLNKKIEGASENVLKILTEYDWPGNIREFENTVMNMCIKTHGTVLRSSSIPDYIRSRKLEVDDLSFLEEFLDTYLENADPGRPVLPGLIPMIEETVIKLLKRRYGNNKTKIASVMGISRVTLLKKMSRYGL